MDVSVSFEHVHLCLGYVRFFDVHRSSGLSLQNCTNNDRLHNRMPLALLRHHVSVCPFFNVRWGVYVSVSEEVHVQPA